MTALTDAISSAADADSPYTVKRQASSTLVDGYRIAGAITTIPAALVGTIQPHDGRTLMPLPDGYRSEDVRIVYTNSIQLHPQDEQGACDAVVYRSEDWVVIKSDRWEGWGSVFCVALIARQAVAA